MSAAASYAPPGPHSEAAIEVAISVSEGVAHFRIPFSSLSQVFHTISDSRENMFRTFNNSRLGIWSKLLQKRPLPTPGEVYTVTAEDLSWGESIKPTTP